MQATTSQRAEVPERLYRAVPFILAGVIGMVWGASPAALLLVPGIICLWARASSHLAAFALLWIYYLTASRGLFPGIATYFANDDGTPAYFTALVFWAAPNGLLAGVWSLFWRKQTSWWRPIAAGTITALPPIGVIGWASPILGAGIWYPGLGWSGLVVYLLLIVALQAAATSPRSMSKALVGALLGVAVLANTIYKPPSPPSEFIGVDTRFGAGRELAEAYDQLQDIEHILERVSRTVKPGTVLVFPESISNDWELSSAILDAGIGKRMQARGVTALIGAQTILADGAIENGVYEVGAQRGKKWINRVPVPAGLWRPFSRTSVRPAWFASGVTPLGNLRVASLVCYEQALVWPALLSASAGVDIFIAPSNLWWARETSLQAIQHQSAESAARLFRIPIVFAANL